MNGKQREEPVRERREAIEHLTSALGKVLGLGVGDLPADAQRVLGEKLAQGCRIEFAIRLSPLHVICYAADQEQRVELFAIETGDAPGRLELN